MKLRSLIGRMPLVLYLLHTLLVLLLKQQGLDPIVTTPTQVMEKQNQP